MSAAFSRVIALILLVATPQSSRAAPDESLQFLQALDQRIADVSWSIAAANAPLCPRRTNALGFSVHDVTQYAATYRRAAIATFDFGDGLPAVLAVARGGPAAAAGLKVGDRIASINGRAVPAVLPRAGVKQDYASISAVMSRLEELPADRPASLGILRGNSPATFEIRPTTVCHSRVEVVPSGEINANSNGDAVQIYGKLALWTRNDDELAIIIAHEMAHNILGHNRKIEREKIGSGLFAGIGRGGRKLRDMEREADRYGLYLVARAGYDYRPAPDFWRGLSMTTGLGGIWATTHPSAGNREAFNSRVVAEIERKMSGGEELVP